MSRLPFADRLVVITGVGRAGQVGEAIAAHFASLGAALALLDRDAGEVAARGAELQRVGGPRITTHVADLSDPADAQRAATDVLAVHAGRVDALICVAGGFAFTGPVDEADPALWEMQFRINLQTAFATTRAFLPALRVAQGSIVYFGSVAATPGGSSRGLAAYAAAKSAVLSLMRTVAEDEAPNGVRANAVAPGAIRTASNVADMGDGHRYVEREALAEVVAFLATPGRAVSGQVITVS